VDPASYGIAGRYFDGAGIPTGPEFLVNAFTTGYQGAPAVGSDGTGFVVVWEDYHDHDGHWSGVFGQRFGAGGVPVGSEFLVNAYTTGNQSEPDVAVEASGEFLVVWENGGEIFGRHFDPGGVPSGPDFQINVGTTGNQIDPAVAVGGGGFVVTWIRSPGGTDVIARRLDGDGVPLGGEFLVNTYVTGAQSMQSVAGGAGGDFVVTWSSDDERDGSRAGIFGQRFLAGGAPLGPEFQVNAYWTLGQASPSVAPLPAGGFVVAWTSPAPGDADVSGHRFLCGNGVVDAGEGCDDGNPVDGDGCESTCAPTGCGDEVVGGGEQCDDGNLLNGDCCSAACQFEAGGNPCPSDENACTLDVCDGAGTCGVPAPPAGGCRQPTQSGRGVLRMKPPSTLVWRWLKGQATDVADFGDPFTEDDPPDGVDGTGYSLCLYDASAAPQPVLSAVAPPGGLCALGQPCWRTNAPLLIDYKDRDADPDGVHQVRLRAGTADGDARIQVRGKGSNLDLPTLPLTPPVRIQLHAETGVCWEATISAPRANTSTVFRGNPD
jgi:cysteine-rich repeat protein